MCRSCGSEPVAALKILSPPSAAVLCTATGRSIRIGLVRTRRPGLRLASGCRRYARHVSLALDIERDPVVAPQVGGTGSFWHRRLFRVALPGAIAAFAVGALLAIARSHRQQIPGLIDAMRHTDPRFLAVAASVMVLGMLNHAALHAAARRAVGLHGSTGSTLGLSVRAAFANKLVKSGGLAAAGVFAADARRRTLPMAQVMVAYGLASVISRAGFAIAIVVCFAAGASSVPWLTILVSLGLAVAAIAARAVRGRLVRRRSPQRRRSLGRRRAAAVGCRVIGWLPPTARARVGSAGPAIAEAMGQARRAPALVVRAFGHALAVELLGAAVLWAALASVGVSISGGRLAVIYATAAIVGMVGPLPAGLGVIEATLGVGLLRAGLNDAQTVSAIAIYRVFQFWIPLIVGAGAVALNRRRGRESSPSVPRRWSWTRTVVRGGRRLARPYRLSTGPT